MQQPNLQNVPTVKINTESAQRYIVAEVFNADESKVVVRSGFHKRSQQELVTALETEAHAAGCAVLLLAGGKLSGADGKTIKLYTDKETAGDPEREARTVPLLKEAFPAFTVTCTGIA